MWRAERQPPCYTPAMADEVDSHMSGQLRQSEPTVAVGAVVALRLFDVAYAIDLARAEGLLAEQARTSRRIRLSATPPKAMAFGVPPLALELEPVVLALEGEDVAAVATVRLYDFGAVTIALRVPIVNVTWADFVRQLNAVDRSVTAADDMWDRLLRRVRELLGPAMNRAEDSRVQEDYLIGVVHTFEPKLTAAALRDSVDLVPLLSGEQRPLSDGARYELLRQRFSYYTDDLVVLTWDRAFVYEPRGDSDVLDVLEVANAQLLEMRYYDELLDDELPRMYDLVAKARRARTLLASRRFAGSGAPAAHTGCRSHRTDRARGQRIAGDRGRISRAHLRSCTGAVPGAGGECRGGAQARDHPRHVLRAVRRELRPAGRS